MAGQMEALMETCRRLPEVWKEETPEGHREETRRDNQKWVQDPERLFEELLFYHQGAAVHFAQAVFYLAKGEQKKARRAWEELREYLCRGEIKFQPYADVYRILEVTQKYTGFRELPEDADRNRRKIK